MLVGLTETDFPMGGCMSTARDPTNERPAHVHVYETPKTAAVSEASRSIDPTNGPSTVRPITGTSSQSISYTVTGGAKVCINLPINPWEVLGLNSTSSSRDDVKLAFKAMIVEPQRQKQASVSLANHILTSTTSRYQQQPGSNMYTIINTDHFTTAACGNTQKLDNMIAKNKYLVGDVDEHGRTLLYLASKSGFVDMVKMLLRNDADIDKVQIDGSTPLHAAAYFGHDLVVNLLLQYGALDNIENTWGQTALQESASTEIKSLFENASSDVISSMAINMKKKQLVSRVRFIYYKGRVIAKEFIRDTMVYDPETRTNLTKIMKEWKLTWHGTHYKNLESILTHGLLPAGTNGIKPLPGHFSLGKKYMEIENWAAAIFLSPSIWYSAHSAYSEKVVSQQQEWCVMIKTYCSPGSYDRYDSTVFKHNKMESEPQYSEYRVPVFNERDEETVILRVGPVESARSVVVRSVVFIRTCALQDEEISHDKMIELFEDL